MSYYYTKSLLNKEWNGSLFIRYYLGLYLIKNVLLTLNTSILFRVNSLLISQRYNYSYT
jgi:hypothetical protein